MAKTQVERNWQEEIKNFQTTSERIRFLLGEGNSRSEVAKILNIRYQHVRNVQIQPIKKKK